MEFDEAMQELDEQITELQELKLSLVRARLDVSLEEETYHKMCRTSLRCTDALGKSLGERLGFTYIKRSPNYFHYILPNDWELRIPSYDYSGAEIVVPHYYKKDIKEENEIYFCEKELCSVRNKIDRIEREFFNGNYFSKVKCVYGKKFRHNALGFSLMFICYFFRSLKRNYGKRYAEILADLKKQESDLERKLYQNKKEFAGKYDEQQMMIEVYSKRLFNWTETVRIYAESWNNNAILTLKKNGE